MREFAYGDRDVLVCMHRDERVRARLLDDYPLDLSVVAQTFIERLQSFYRTREGLGIWFTERRAPTDDQDLAEARAAVAQGELADSVLDWLAQPQWRFCGWFNLMPMPNANDRVEIGCRLTTDAWGAGLAVEGLGAVLEHAFTTLKLPAVWGICHPLHRAVDLCLLTLGFVPEAQRDYEGQFASWFSIDAQAWARAKSRPLRERQRFAVGIVRQPHRRCLAETTVV